VLGPDFKQDFTHLLRAIAEKPIDDLTAEADDLQSEQKAGPNTPFQGLDDLIEAFTKQIDLNPRNVRPLLLRGQVAYKNATDTGARGYTQAVEDFRRVRAIDDTSAEARLGLAAVYDVAILDLVKRGLYKVESKGKMGLGPSGQFEIIPPRIEAFPDDHTRILLFAALEEIQAGFGLQQSHESNTVMWDPHDMNRRFESLRMLLGYAPRTEPDPYIYRTLTLMLIRKDAKRFADVFVTKEPSPTQASPAHQSGFQRLRNLVSVWMSGFRFIA
jgi:hypothetical protein